MYQAQPLARLGQLSFAPGTNRRGYVSGAAWSYALPTQDLSSVVCLGNPSAAAVSRLSQLADRVHVITPAHDSNRWRRTVGEGAWPNVVVDEEVATDSSQPPDLVWLAVSGRRLPSAQAERWRELVGRARLVYRERRSTAQLSPGTLTLRLTPLFGEPRSAVPAADEVTLQHFRAAGLAENSVSRELHRRGIPLLPAAARKVEEAAPPIRVFERFGLLSGADLPDGHAPPRYLRAIAEAEGVDLHQHRWGLSAKGQYASQKTLFFLYRSAAPQPELIVKMSQDPSRSHLLDNAYRGMRLLEATEFGAAGRLPKPRFMGSIRDLRLVGEEVVAGTAFTRRSSGGPECPYAADAVAALIELGRNAADQCRPARLGQTLAGLLDQFLALYRPEADLSAHLEQQIAALSRIEEPLPLVFMHGDPGLQNLVVRPDNGLALLDWENAEPAGVPLWDLYHFLRAYVTWAGRRRTLTSRSAAITEHYLKGSSLTGFLVASVERYCRSLEIDGALVEPLFWTHLSVQALREAPRLDPSKLQEGHQFKMLRLLVAGRHSGVLRRVLRVES